MDYNAASGSGFGLPHIDLNGLSAQDMGDLLTNYTNQEEVSTPNGGNCYMPLPSADNRLPQFSKDGQLQASGQQIGYSEPQETPSAHVMDNNNPRPQEVYYNSPQNFSKAETAGTPSHAYDNTGTINAGGPMHSQGGSVGTPNSGPIMATPHSAYAAPTPGTFNYHNMHSGFTNDGLPSARFDPLATPSRNPRADRYKHQQPNATNNTELPDTSDLIIAPVRPPPSLRHAAPSNSGTQHGVFVNGYHGRMSTPNAGSNSTAAMVCPEAMQQSAESLIRSLEVICAETTNTLGILKRQCRSALRVYHQCAMNPNIEEGKYHWEKYIGEIRSQYDSIRDCMWGCIRYLVSRLSVWCKEYKIPEEIFHRACDALKTGKGMKVEIDKFRYPDWNAMAIARLAVTQNPPNANNVQQRNQ